MSDARQIENKPALPLPRVLEIVGNVKKGQILVFADETGQKVIAADISSDTELAELITAINKRIDELSEGNVAHVEDYNNPHKVKVGQLTDKSAGTLVIVFDDVPQNLSGEFRFEFDPYMFNRGNLSFTLNVGEYAPPPIANRTINYNGKVHIIENWEGNNQWPVFVTEGRVGDSVYFYVQVIDLKEDATSSARLFFLIGGDGDATSPSQITPFGDCVPSTISEFVYRQGGIFQVLTEKILRDKETHKAYTICVENGELKLQEYRISEYEG